MRDRGLTENDFSRMRKQDDLLLFARVKKGTFTCVLEVYGLPSTRGIMESRCPHFLPSE